MHSGVLECMSSKVFQYNLLCLPQLLSCEYLSSHYLHCQQKSLSASVGAATHSNVIRIFFFFISVEVEQKQFFFAAVESKGSTVFRYNIVACVLYFHSTKAQKQIKG